MSNGGGTGTVLDLLVELRTPELAGRVGQQSLTHLNLINPFQNLVTWAGKNELLG